MDGLDRISYLNSKEIGLIPNHQTLSHFQDDRYLRNRTILVEWIGEVLNVFRFKVCEGNNFSLKTFELSVRYTDIYLS